MKIKIDFTYNFFMKYFAFILIFLISMNLYSRKEVNIWYFGNRAGLDFSSGIPVAITDSKLNSNEGCATLSDRFGKLLFYTDGSNVWDRQHNLMPNGTGLLGHTSSTQSSVIVPVPENDSLFYIFTVDDKDRSNGFRYTLVNIKRNNGLGEIDSTVKNVLLFAPSAEKIVAINNHDCSGVWVISHEWNSDTYRAYLVTSNGVDTINYVVSNVGIKYEGSVHNKKGYLKAYSDGSKIAAASGYTSTFELFDFDNETGIISNPIKLTSSDYEAYGVEFSPDGSKLYATVNNRSIWFWDENEIWQYDLSSGVQSTIGNSRRTIHTQELADQYGALQLGPDGKIYVAREGSSYLGVINNPNASGSSCNYNNSGINLGGRTCVWGLPFFIQSYFYNKCFIDIPDMKKKVGTQKVKVPIYANLNCGNTDTLTLSYEMKIKFDVSIFYFQSVEKCNYSNLGISDGKYMTLILNYDSLRITSEPIVIGELIGDILMGWDSDATLFQIESFDLVNSNVDFDTSSGLLTTFGVCQPDLRRIVFLEDEILRVQPNPVSDYFKISVRTAGSAQYELKIYNESGMIVWSNLWESEYYGGEEKEFDIDFTDNSQGVYFVEFKSPFNILHKKIILMK